MSHIGTGFDPRCIELARYFLDAECVQPDEGLVWLLASRIAEAVDEWFAEPLRTQALGPRRERSGPDAIGL